MSTAETIKPTTNSYNEPAVDRVARAAHDTIDRAANAAHSAAENVNASAARVKTAQQDVLANACSFVRENPVQALGIAAAAGFVIARLLKR